MCGLFAGITKTDLPPGVLYRVQATYRYDKEDADELSFEIGETVNVIEYDDPEDQVRVETFIRFRNGILMFFISLPGGRMADGTERGYW